MRDIRRIVTLPPASARAFRNLGLRASAEWEGVSDPPGRSLGSGGGTACALYEAFRRSSTRSFSDWLEEGRTLLIHSGGKSRRLPAYATTGKALMPVPVFRWSIGQRLDQTLLDLLQPFYEQVLRLAGPSARVLVATGDVLFLPQRALGPLPDADVVCLGIWSTPEEAQHHGAIFTDRKDPTRIVRFLQKPSPAEIRSLSASHGFMLDSGIWLLSRRAVEVLGRRSGLEWESGDPSPAAYELYAGFGLALGSEPHSPDPEIGGLSCAAAPLAARFFHWGTSLQMIEAASELHNLVVDQQEGRLGATAVRHPDQHIQNARFDPIGRLKGHERLWIENSCVPRGWTLRGDHVLTGLLENDWNLELPSGACLDFVPVEGGICIRFYGFEDAMSGPVERALLMGRPAAEWSSLRHIDWAAAGIDPSTDVHGARLYPVVRPGDLEPSFLRWLFSAGEPDGDRHLRTWRESVRLSAEDLTVLADVDAILRQRGSYLRDSIERMYENRARNVFYQLDLLQTAQSVASAGLPWPERMPESSESDVMRAIHDRMFRAAVCRARGTEGEAYEREAFAALRSQIIEEAALAPVEPQCGVQGDQIVWARSPVRLDLAGGWTDTPPYCLEFGGTVLNVAVDLNGQPPIQVFAKLCREPRVVLRSIDLGIEQQVRTYEELEEYANPRSGFTLAKAALALAGFLPAFSSERHRSLAAQLEAFGGGIELSLLAAVPQGSGLGTSSVLAATVLGALSQIGCLGWDKHDLVRRTLALEQMLTTGGGWQDQAGGVFHGIKVIETRPGLVQTPTFRWLPTEFFEAGSERLALLYYTGITRLAKNILQDIVRGMFLNSQTHLDIIREIGANVEPLRDAIQRQDWEGVCSAVRTSWELNQRLDPGTNPPEVQAILDRIGDDWHAGKLLGAGGGGYLLIFPRDPEAKERIRRSLTENPPNPRARFVDFSISKTGLEVTQS